MSESSPREVQEDIQETKQVDELDDNAASADAESGIPTAQPASDQPVKRGRGRPRGSKNKGAPSTATIPKRPRGRPPKEKKTEEEAAESSTPKRGRGRPPKHPRPAPDSAGEGANTSDTGEPPAKKKRGRPKKNA